MTKKKKSIMKFCFDITLDQWMGGRVETQRLFVKKL